MKTFLRPTQDASIYEPVGKLRFECVYTQENEVTGSTIVSAGSTDEAAQRASLRFAGSSVEDFTCAVDTSYITERGALNTGIDEILEVGKNDGISGENTGTQRGVVRFLINFDIPSNNQYPPDAKYFLNLYLANASTVNRYQLLNVHPITQEWIEGSGYRVQDRVNMQDGCTWILAKKNVAWESLGGDFLPTISASYEFSSIPIQDVRVDITNIISPVVNNTNISPWYGLIAKFPAADETDPSNIGNIKFFSGNTKTIFEPRLEIAWNDQVFITGSLKPINDSNVKVVARNLKQSYTRGEIDKIYLVVRDPYPDKRFDAVQRYKNMYYLPSSSYFRITDSVSGIKIYDFDEYSTINCDASGSYILLNTLGLDVDRFYKIELKVQTNSLVFFPSFNYEFKVETSV
jgi:hypothetical protein